ncbi:MAG: hypothetical protein JSW54_11165 [Fidelibacterota bacterium]|nr:MAG: hypothetical protein JSW54_11165 [Candidatus Neomarinimicrobiota bacterium]
MVDPTQSKQRDEDKLKIGEPGFWASWFSKLLFTLISVKVWGLVAGTAVSTYLYLRGVVIIDDKTIIKGFSGAQWVTFNTTVWALIFGMKEVFRIAGGRDKAERQLAEQQAATEEKLTALKLQNSHMQLVTPEGHEIVAEEPD